jgi:hypothetical protein
MEVKLGSILIGVENTDTDTIDKLGHSQTLFKNLPVSHLSVNIQSPPSGIGLKCLIRSSLRNEG